MKFGDMSASLEAALRDLPASEPVVIVTGAMFIMKGYYSRFFISVGTVILIIGIAMWMMASPDIIRPQIWYK